MRWLITEHQKATRRAAVGGEEAPAGVETGVSRKTKMRLLEAILKDSTVAVTDRIRAMEQHNRLAAEEAGDQKRGLADLDPVEVCEIFRQASEQGIDPEEWAKRQKDPQQVVCPVPEEGPKPENVEKAGESE